MELFSIALIAAALLCSLVAGFLFAFAVVVMPGLKDLGDREFLRAFQVIDRVIQRGQPLFMAVWVGSILAVVTVGLGSAQFGPAARLRIIAAAVAYLVGVQLPTMLINVPLNNRLQSLDVDAMNVDARRAFRAEFEPRWNRWNRIRTVVAILVSALLMIELFKL